MPARKERCWAQDPSNPNDEFLAEYECMIDPPGKRRDYQSKASFDHAKAIFDRKGGCSVEIKVSEYFSHPNCL